MANKRIKDLTEKNVLASGDYFPIDNSTDGTKKVNSSKILDPISHVQGEVSGSGDSYSSSKSYAKGDLVIHNNVLYVCTSACTSGSWATNSSHFTATTLASEVTDVKQTLTTKLNKNNITPSNHILSTNVAAANYQPNELISYADSLFYTTKKVNSGETISGSTNVSQTTLNSIMTRRNSFLETWESSGTTTITIPIGEKLIFLFGGRRNKCFAIILLPNGEHSIMCNENDIINSLTWTVTDSVGTLTFTWNSVYGTTFMGCMFT